jgi:competence protein ComEA
MPRRFALLAAVLLSLVPAAIARRAALPSPPKPACVPEGRGEPPRHWVGCATDPGPPRGLDGAERLAFGLPLDVNRATATELARVPGFTPRLAAAIVADRSRRGPFRDVDELERVAGVGRRRLSLARPVLSAARPPQPRPP